MRRWFTSLAALSLFVAAPVMAQEPAAPAAASDVQVEAEVGTAVAERMLSGAAQSFPASVGRVYCFTRVTGAEAGSQVQHVWYHGDEEVARVTLNIGGSPWRTWSSKTLPEDAAGQWRVDVVQNDQVLTSVSFTVE